MSTRYWIPAIILCAMTACNNSSKKEDTMKDTTVTMDHDSMPPVSGTVPEMPAVPEGARVYFKDLKDNATIGTTYQLQMGTDVIRIDTAGPVVAGSGHHHLFIDAEDSLATGAIVPKDSAHVHFGKGQTSYELKLTPGKHKLTLQMADGLHRSYGSRLAATIHVNVK